MGANDPSLLLSPRCSYSMFGYDVVNRYKAERIARATHIWSIWEDEVGWVPRNPQPATRAPCPVTVAAQVARAHALRSIYSFGHLILYCDANRAAVRTLPTCFLSRHLHFNLSISVLYVGINEHS